MRMTSRIDLYSKVVLTAIALLLGAVAVHPWLAPAPVRAEMEAPSLFIEPGLTRIPDLRGGPETVGKMVIDLKTGDSWGFPMAFTTSTEPVVSKPVLLGRFDLSAMKRPNKEKP
jgi:hypothetical protein